MARLPTLTMLGNKRAGTKFSNLKIVNTKISDGKVIVAVCVWPPTLVVDKRLARVLLKFRPSLAQHACKEHGLGNFGDKLVGATFAHLLEHLVIDMLVEQKLVAQQLVEQKAETQQLVEQKMVAQQNLSGQKFVPGKSLDTAKVTAAITPVAGNTKWLDKSVGLAQVTIVDATSSSAIITQTFECALGYLNTLMQHAG